MFLSKRNGVYYLFYEQASGKRTCVSTKTKVKKEAIRFLINFKQKKIESNAEVAQSITFKTLQNEFLKYSATRHSFKTSQDYQSAFKKYIKFFGNCPINTIDRKKIEEYIQLRFQSSVYVASKDQRYLKSIFNWAVNQEYLEVNPCNKIKNIKLPERQPLFLSRSDYNKLIETIDDVLIKHIVIFATYTGLRLGELLTLSWEQVDLEKKMILLSNQTHITKSKKVRSLPLNNSALVVIQERMGISDKLVFTKEGLPIRNDYLTHKFKDYIIKAGLNKKLKFHSLRHTFASWLVQKGVTIYEVSKLLGHSDIKTTEIYAHLSPENFRSSVDLL